MRPLYKLQMATKKTIKNMQTYKTLAFTYIYIENKECQNMSLSNDSSN